MQYVLGLDLSSSVPSAAIIDLGGAVSRPREFPSLTLPSVRSGEPVHASDPSIVAATSRAIELARQRHSGERPAAVTLVHPLAWDAHRIGRVRRALASADLEVTLVDAAVAAAVDADVYRAARPGHVIAVVALRPGGAEVRALRTDGPGSFHPIGTTVSVEGVTESELDASLLAIVADHLEGGLPNSGDDAARAAAREKLQLAAHSARERLCSDESTFVGVRLPGRATVVDVDRTVFHNAVAGAISATIPSWGGAILAAGGGSVVDEILITGAAAPAPLIAELLAVELDLSVRLSDVRHGRAFGAARLASMVVPAASQPELESEAELDPRPEAETQPESGGAPILETELVPVAPLVRAGAISSASQVERQLVTTLMPTTTADTTKPRRRTPTGLLQLWPIAAAAAVLIVLGGAAATGAIDLAPVGTRSTTWPGAPTNETGDASAADDPSSTPNPPDSATGTSANMPRGTSDGTGSSAKTGGRADGSKGSDDSIGSDGSSASSNTPSSNPSPSDTPSGSPSPTPSDAPTTSPSPDPTPGEPVTLPPIVVPSDPPIVLPIPEPDPDPTDDATP